MDVYGKAQSQRVIGSNGRELKYSPLYQRHYSLQEIDIPVQLPSKVRWTKREATSEGCLRFVRDDERGCVQSNREFGRRFTGIFLEKVEAENNFANKFPMSEEFYPVLENLLKKRLNWGKAFCELKRL